MRTEFPIVTILLLGAGLSAIACSAQAQELAGAKTQDTSPSDQAAEASTQAAGEQPVSAGPQGNEIVVTAQKRAEDVQKIPIAITALGSQQLTASGITNTMQLGTVVPGVTIRESTGSFQPFIRGVGTSTSLAENPVALYIDDVYYPEQREGVRELVNLDQVAVLKGPQGTLFGRNATGGVIQMTTKDPSTDSAAGRFAVGLDNYLTLKTSAYLSTPIGENNAADISAAYTTQGDGWGRNVNLHEDVYKILHDLTLRSKWIIGDGDRTKVTLIGDYGNRRDSMLTFRVLPGTLPQYPDSPQPLNPRDTQSAVPGRFFIKSGGGSAKISHDLDFATLTSISAYRQGISGYSFDALQQTFLTQTNIQEQDWKIFTQELQLVSNNSSPLSWALGGYYFRKRDTVDYNPTYAGPVATPASDPVVQRFNHTSELTNSLAAYAQATYEVAPGTKLTGGLRYTTEKRSFNGDVAYDTQSGNHVQTLTTSSSIKARRLTWRLAVDQELGPDALVYASYNRGFKSGGYNLNSPTNPPYKPETIDAYETGLKSEFLDHRLRLNLAAFYYDYRNVQVTSYTTVPVVTNGAKAELYGAEADLNYYFTDNFRLFASASLLHARFVNYDHAQCSIPKPTGGITLYSCDAAGNHIPFSQPFVGMVGLEYAKSTKMGEILANITNSYNTKYYTEADNYLYQPSFDILNASVKWTSTDGAVAVQLWGKNLLNETVSSLLYTAGTRAYLANYGQPPRQVGITLSTSF